VDHDAPGLECARQHEERSSRELARQLRWIYVASELDSRPSAQQILERPAPEND
jgi:hypothetical protein